MKIKVHQIYFKPEQKPKLDSDFIPFDNAGKFYPHNFEYAVFFEIFKAIKWNLVDLVGTVSWKFKSKTGLNGSEFIAFIEANQGYDVYFVNPFPELAIYPSVWEQGRVYHQDLVNISRTLFAQLGYSVDLLNQETPPNLTAYCNYWVGNKKFWDEYIGFLTPLWSALEQSVSGQSSPSLPPELGALADANINAPYAPFIFERLFSTFLASKKFKTISMPIKREHRKVYRYLEPLWNAVQRVSTAQSHHEVTRLDAALVWAYVKVSFIRGYQMPLVLKWLGFPNRGKR